MQLRPQKAQPCPPVAACPQWHVVVMMWHLQTPVETCTHRGRLRAQLQPCWTAPKPLPLGTPAAASGCCDELESAFQELAPTNATASMQSSYSPTSAALLLPHTIAPAHPVRRRPQRNQQTVRRRRQLVRPVQLELLQPLLRAQLKQRLAQARVHPLACAAATPPLPRATPTILVPHSTAPTHPWRRRPQRRQQTVCRRRQLVRPIQPQLLQPLLRAQLKQRLAQAGVIHQLAQQYQHDGGGAGALAETQEACLGFRVQSAYLRGSGFSQHITQRALRHACTWNRMCGRGMLFRAQSNNM